LNYHSPDPTDPAVTVRVITVMLADVMTADGPMADLAARRLAAASKTLEAERPDGGGGQAPKRRSGAPLGARLYARPQHRRE
jgi:hypothetical protein